MPPYTGQEDTKEDFEYRIFALGGHFYTVKTSRRSQMNPKKILYNTALSAQLLCLRGHFLLRIVRDPWRGKTKLT